MPNPNDRPDTVTQTGSLPCRRLATGDVRDASARDGTPKRHNRVASISRAHGIPVFLAWLVCWLAPPAGAQDWRYGTLMPEDDFLKSGPSLLSAFAPVAEATRHSVVILAVDGWRAALGTIVDTNGFIITKASELKAGKLTCTLTSGRETEGKVVATDDENDVALVKTDVKALQPMVWASGEAAVGQWVLTPDVGTMPVGVGIISVPSRKILPKRALIGVLLGTNAGPARILELTPGFGAEKAGLKPGDAILAVNGKPMGERAELVKVLREFRDGQTVSLRVKRDDMEFDASVEMKAESALVAALSRRGRGRGGDRGFDREERMNRMGGGISRRAEDFELAIQHDTVLEPWQCGGPLVNLDGKAVGINIARAGRVASYALPAELAQRIIDDLKALAESGGRDEDTRTISD